MNYIFFELILITTICMEYSTNICPNIQTGTVSVYCESGAFVSLR